MATKPTSTKPKKAKRSTTRAAATTPKAAAKTAAKAPKATVVKAAATAASGSAEAARPEATKKDIVASMMASSGMKKGDARRAMEATMTAIAAALAEGKDLSLPPLGKIKIARMKDTPNGKLVVLRAKLKEATPPVAKDPLAEAAE